MGIPLRRGRDVQRDRHLTQPLVAVVSESFVEPLPARSAIRSASGSSSPTRSAPSSASSATCACEAPSGAASRRSTCPTRRSTTSRFRSSRPRTSRSASTPRPWRPAARAAPDRAGRGSRTAGRRTFKRMSDDRRPADGVAPCPGAACSARSPAWRWCWRRVGIHGLLAFTVVAAAARNRRAHGARRRTAADRPRHRPAERTARIGRRRAGRSRWHTRAGAPWSHCSWASRRGIP